MTPSANEAPQAKTKTFFLYVDDSGTQVVVDSMKKVPARYRGAVRKSSLPVQTDTGGSEQRLSDLGQLVGQVKVPAAIGNPDTWAQTVAAVHWPSVGLGAVAGALLWAIWVGLGRGRKWILKTLVVGMALALVASVYLGWLRRHAGLTNQTLSTPRAIVDDARKAATQLSDHYRDQNQLIEQISEGDVAAPTPQKRR